MKMKIIAWTFEADIHCPECALKRFGPALHNVDTKDSDGNPLHPVFSTYELEPGTCCGDCLEVICD